MQHFLDDVLAGLCRGIRLMFRDFGFFGISMPAPRVAQNPKTLVRVWVPAKKTVKFKVGRLMKLALQVDPDDAGSGNGAAAPAIKKQPQRNRRPVPVGAQ